MGCLGEGVGMLVGGAVGKAEEKAKLEAMKKGKSPEQKRVIDFFMVEPGCGCLGGNKKIMTMDEYLSVVKQKVISYDMKNKAIAKIGLDISQISEIQPLVLTSFVYGDDVFYNSDEKRVVTNKYSVTWVFFSAEQIFTYRFIFDTTSDNTSEYTRDFFYTDVTCFSTSTIVTEKIDTIAGCGCINGETINKTLFKKDTFSIVAPGTEYTMSMTNSDTMERSIQAARAMLREKKYSK